MVAKGGGGGRNQQERALRGERNCCEHWCQNRDLTRKIRRHPPPSISRSAASNHPSRLGQSQNLLSKLNCKHYLAHCPFYHMIICQMGQLPD